MDEADAEFLERRWFAACGAAQAAQSQCEVLLTVMQLAQDEWRRARVHLGEMQELRDALGRQIASFEMPYGSRQTSHRAKSAA